MTVVPLQRLHAFPLLDVDEERWEARVEGRLVHLTRLEFELLAALHNADGRVITRRRMAELLDVYDGSVRAIDAHVCRVRAKLGPAAQALVTVRGVGWKLYPS
jgi:DNA-binding response OmpR family regulator